MKSTIGKFAAAAGVGVETVRYYQRQGLLPLPPRDGAVRRYDDGDLRRLRFIRMAKTAGFTLEEIKELIALDAGQDRHRAHQLALSRLAALEAKLIELQQAHAALRRLADECGGGGSGPCPILASFGV